MCFHLAVSHKHNRDATGLFAKIAENLRVHAVSQKMNTKRDKVQKEKDEKGENRE